ncbi:ribokinase [Thermoactinomyces mirandus]|uniref:Ribokinase n=1 Tax=Thermoactinomyces mirandus TaxID=2756294 RepID=A0A7W2APU0_9BACL|nr:ribokinase [Thermoactinomyces mirandus]MBA4601309.1 ribokinase [Thermoactinomyces mirandus]
MAKIAVIGSLSIDLVVSADKRPQAGETVLGNSFETVPGGKGANQAVAAAWLGAEVIMIGRVGNDSFGNVILENLKANQVKTQYVEPVTHARSGTAHITLAEGDNSIVVVKGANDFTTPEYVRKAETAIRDADVVLIQCEVPDETVEYTADLCERLGVPLLLNPAPARPISKDVIARSAFITPNEHEYKILFDSADRSEVLRKYPNKLIITEGKKGVRFFNGEKEMVIPGVTMPVVDTTGAGDTFNAAFAVAIAEGKSIENTLEFANLAAALSVTKFGAQSGMPTMDEVQRSKQG